MVQPNVRCIEVKCFHLFVLFHHPTFIFSFKPCHQPFVCKTCKRQVFVPIHGYSKHLIGFATWPFYLYVMSHHVGVSEFKYVSLMSVDCMSPTVQGITLGTGNEVAAAKKQITLLLIRLFKMVS